jgi:hypothetical protein
MARLKSSARKTIMVSGHGPIRQHVKPRKKVRFAEDPIPEQNKPSKKANPAQASLHQTIEGRVCKSCGGAKTPDKDERARRAKAHRGLDKLLDEYLASDDDMNVDASEETIEGEPQDGPEGMTERPDEPPQRRWKYHGPGRWTPIQEGEEEVAADANTYSSTVRPYLVVLHHEGEESKFEINGTALGKCLPSSALLDLDDGFHLTSQLSSKMIPTTSRHTSSPRFIGECSGGTSSMLSVHRSLTLPKVMYPRRCAKEESRPLKP